MQIKTVRAVGDWTPGLCDSVSGSHDEIGGWGLKYEKELGTPGLPCQPVMPSGVCCFSPKC